MMRTEDAVDTVNAKNDLKRIHVRFLLRVQKVGTTVEAGRVFPAQTALAIQRDQAWWEQTHAEEGLRKRNCVATRKYRHGSHTPMRRWEAPSVEAFGVDWKRRATANDGARRHESRWELVSTVLKNYKIRMTSLPENLPEPDMAKERQCKWRKATKATQK